MRLLLCSSVDGRPLDRALKEENAIERTNWYQLPTKTRQNRFGEALEMRARRSKGGIWMHWKLPRICPHCGTTRSRQWRLGEHGQYLCDRCGQRSMGTLNWPTSVNRESWRGTNSKTAAATRLLPKGNRVSHLRCSRTSTPWKPQFPYTPLPTVLPPTLVPLTTPDVLNVIY